VKDWQEIAGETELQEVEEDEEDEVRERETVTATHGNRYRNTTTALRFELMTWPATANSPELCPGADQWLYHG